MTFILKLIRILTLTFPMPHTYTAMYTHTLTDTETHTYPDTHTYMQYTNRHMLMLIHTEHKTLTLIPTLTPTLTHTDTFTLSLM